MAFFCECAETLSNTGTPSKQRIIRDGKKLYIVLLKADDGTANVILDSDILDQTFLDAKVNNDGDEYYWIAIQDSGDDEFDVETYTGTGDG